MRTPNGPLISLLQRYASSSASVAARRRERYAGSIPAASTFGSTKAFPRASLGNDSDLVILNGLEQRFRELLDVPVRVDVTGRLDRLMAEQLLDGLEVARGIEDTRWPAVWRPCQSAHQR